MSNTAITYLVAACAGVFSCAAWVGLIVAPAWGAYSTLWQRVAALFLSVYVLAALLLLGGGAGVVLVRLWLRYA